VGAPNVARMTTTGVHVHRAERADVLADALADVLARPLADPFAAEVVAVPAKGVERWLAQRLSHHLGAPGGDGVCAGVAFRSPAAIVADAVAGLGVGTNYEDPWRPERAVWPLLEVLDAAVDEPWCSPLRAHRSRRHALARRVAELFAAYATHRPELLRGWAAGIDGVDPDLTWQPELWRRLRTRIGAPDPTERLEAACAALRADSAAVAFPERLSFFGPTRLAAQELAVLAALAVHREIHLWLPHPSPALWAQVRPCGVPPRDADPSAAAAAHPLLSSLGRDVREMQVRLTAALPDARDQHHPRPDPPPTLLGRLQRDLRDDRPPDSTFVPAAGDRSVQVHACHGPDRQVEVLREVVLGLLAADPTLEAREVLVMCPDIETFAPLISASFGPGAHPAQDLPVRLADRALRQVNPLLDVVARLLELADARLTASQVLDLLAAGPVRTRFALDDGDLERLRELAVGSGVRWGFDAAHRRPFKLESFGQNTWSSGLDRLLLGVAMSGDEHTWLGTALPAAVEPGDTARLGRLAEFVERLEDVLTRLNGEQPLAQWSGALADALDLLTATSATDAWQAGQARAELAEAAQVAGPHAASVRLGLADVRSLLAERLRGRPTRAGFRTGTLTVATLVPMRSVPHRVVCLLGLDDGVFPRAGAVDGDDALARRPLVGERDTRSEDRQLLLDAIMAATETLVVVHSGADERTGLRRPPAVPLGELLDAVAATAPSAKVVVRHPLQPFDARNFAAHAPFSFDRAELAGARAAAAPRSAPPPFLPTPLPRPEPRVVSLDELVAFLEQPVKGFLTQRVGLSLFAGDEAPADALPVAPDGLATWAIGHRLLADRLAGRDLDRCRQAEWRRGDLPPGALGDALLARVLDDVEPLVAAAAEFRTGTPADQDVDLELPDGARVFGTIGGLQGHTVLRVEYSRLTPKQRIRSWVRLVALTAASGEPWQAVTIGRGERFGIARSVVGPVDHGHARAVVAEMVAMRTEGLCAPLPLSAVTGNTYARVRQGGASPADALEEAARAWANGAGAERADPAHERVWGRGAPASVLTGEAGPLGGEPTRFGTLALRLWHPLLQAEELIRR
jgi:exodeoxyribonuclease V gamma subunit